MGLYDVTFRRQILQVTSWRLIWKLSLDFFYDKASFKHGSLTYRRAWLRILHLLPFLPAVFPWVPFSSGFHSRCEQTTEKGKNRNKDANKKLVDISGNCWELTRLLSFCGMNCLNILTAHSPIGGRLTKCMAFILIGLANCNIKYCLKRIRLGRYEPQSSKTHR